MARPKYVCVKDCLLMKPYQKKFTIGDLLPDDFEPNKYFELESTVKELDKKAFGG